MSVNSPRFTGQCVQAHEVPGRGSGSLGGAQAEGAAEVRGGGAGGGGAPGEERVAAGGRLVVGIAGERVEGAALAERGGRRVERAGVSARAEDEHRVRAAGDEAVAAGEGLLAG